MKNLFNLFLLSLMCSSTIMAQIPVGFSYQAVARNDTGACLADTLISVQFSILDDSASNNTIYKELFSSVQTNETGHFQINIGSGALQDGSPAFEDLHWNNSGQQRHLKVELSPNNDLNLQEVGTTQLLSIPYASAAANGKMFHNEDEDEFLNFVGPNASDNVLIGGWNDGNGDKNNGAIQIFGDNGNEAIRMFAHSTTSDPGSSGWMHIYGENGTRNIELSMLSGTTAPNHGAIRLRADDDAIKVETGVASSNAGYATFRGPNGNLNVAIGTGSSNPGPDNGAISIRDASGNSQIGLSINASGQGVVAADVKNFFMDHPTQAGKEIWYASLEGPEAAAYERGTATLVNGEAEVVFSEHFEIVANPATMTVMTSPWSADAKGLAIIERTEKGFKVKELHGGTGNYPFDWEAKAVRKGWEDYQVIRDKEKDSFSTIK